MRDDLNLTPRDRALLDFERDWVRHHGAKQSRIHETFGISAARYYRLLNRLIDSPLADAYDPLTVRRLKRRRDQRAQRRTARALGMRERS